MRIKITINTQNKLVPFNYQEDIISWFHGAIGRDNKIHDAISLYSFSWLNGRCERVGQQIRFLEHPSLYISSHDIKLLDNLTDAIIKNNLFIFDTRITSFELVETPVFNRSIQRFTCQTPVFIKNPETQQFIFFDNPESDLLLTKTLKNKLKTAGLDDSNVYVGFDTEYKSPKTKGFNYNGFQLIGSVCPIIIQGTQEQIEFAWNVGVGNSTGMGFGFLK